MKKKFIHFVALVHPDNQMLGFLAYNPVDGEFVFEKLNFQYLIKC